MSIQGPSDNLKSSRVRQLLQKLTDVDQIISNISERNIPLSDLQNESTRRELKSIELKGARAPPGVPGLSKSTPMTVGKHRSKKATTKPLENDLAKPQMTYCPKCMGAVQLQLLRKHMGEECPNNEIDCPEVECKAKFTADHLAKHLELECIPTRRRKALVEQMRMRKVKEKERLTELKEKAVADYKAKMEAERKETERLEREAYEAELIGGTSRPVSREKSQAELDAEMEKRLPICEQCFEEVSGSNMNDHMLQHCPMRLSYCPNADVHGGGCTERVPFMHIESHLKYNCTVEKFKNELVRKALARCAPVKCNGCGKIFEMKRLLYHETHECINRKVPCRNAHLGCPVMVRAKDRARHEEVEGKAKTRYCLYISGDTSYLDLDESDLRTPWCIEFWVYRSPAREACKHHLTGALTLVPLFVDSFLMEFCWRLQMIQLTTTLKTGSSGMSLEDREDVMAMLADTVEALEDASVRSVEFSVQILCALTAAQGCMTEFLGPKMRILREKADSEQGKLLLGEVMCLKRYPPGHIPPPAETRSTATSRPTTHGGSRPGTGPGGSRPGTTKTDKSDESSTSTKLNTWKAPQALKGVSCLQRLMEIEYDNDVIMDFIEQRYVDIEREKEEKEATEAEAAAAAERALLGDGEDGAEGGEGVEGVVVEGISETQDPNDVPSGEGKNGNTNDNRSPLMAGVPIKEIAPPGPSDGPELDEKKADEDGEEVTSRPVSRGFMDQVGLLFSPPPNPAMFLMNSLKCRGRERSRGGTGVLSKEGIMTTLSWLEWGEVCSLLNNALSTDLEVLHGMRLDSGILKEGQYEDAMAGLVVEDESMESKKPEKEETPEEMEARLKEKEEEEKRKAKEKEKLRREMKRNRNKKEVASELAAMEMDEVEGDGVEERSEEEKERERKKAEREARRANREKLIPRLVDAAKANCGRDVICYTKTFNGRGACNKICLDISYPGDESTWSWGKTWLPNKGSGHAGIVSSDTVLGGSGYFSFGKTVPREDWVHLAFVGVTEPANRVNFFMNGLLAGQAKDCVFPLPLSSILGAPHNAGFSGCVLDTRVWSKAKSQLEIRGLMNSLIDLDGSLEPKLGMADYDLTAKGLVGWWTFEDGPKDPEEDMDDDAKDVSEHRAPTVISYSHSGSSKEYNHDHSNLFYMNDAASGIVKTSQGYYTQQLTIQAQQEQGESYKPPMINTAKYWTWENADEMPVPDDTTGKYKPGDDRPLPVPAYSSVGLCPYELKRLRLAQKGRLLQKQMNCPLGCSDFILKKDLRFHVMWMCSLRKVKCRFHPSCNAEFAEHERNEHENMYCQHINTRNVLADNFNKMNLLKRCPQCSEKVRVRDQEQHDREECPFRIITCPHKDCGMSVVAHRLKYHLRFDCESAYVTKKTIMIARARERIGYAQDWGVPVEYDRSPNHSPERKIRFEEDAFGEGEDEHNEEEDGDILAL